MAVHPSGFSPDALDAPLAPLDELPRGLWLQAIVNSVGALPGRLRGVGALRRQLGEGAPVPDGAADWPVPPAAAPFLEAVARLDLARLCRDREALTDQVVQSMLWHSDRIIDYLEADAPEAAARRAAGAFADEWRSMVGEMDQLIHVFGDLGPSLGGKQWAQIRGILASEDWREVVRIRALLERAPRLRALIRSLGRARQTEEPDLERQPQVEVLEQVRTTRSVVREVRIPEVPAETRGVQRGGRIARMLPSEAALLRHPRLRLVWFARHAERCLLTYEDDNRVRETVQEEARAWKRTSTPRPQRKLEMGPMILCVDTSASMAGAPEQVAKATVLEAMRTAAAQKRRCYVYTFSGPEDVVERELGLDAEGIANAVSFIAQSFHGGTDVDEPMHRALARIEQEDWQLADLLIASDGQFGPTPELKRRVAEARERAGLRVQGVLVSDRETVGMRELCSAIFRVDDWRRIGEHDPARAEGDSLAARYFPGGFGGD